MTDSRRIFYLSPKDESARGYQTPFAKGLDQQAGEDLVAPRVEVLIPAEIALEGRLGPEGLVQIQIAEALLRGQPAHLPPGELAVEILRVEVEPAVGLQAFQARELAFALGLDPAILSQAVSTILGCYEAFRRVWNGERRLAGVYFWNWFGWGGPTSKEYTPRNKPAEREVAKWYLGGSLRSMVKQ